MQLGARIEALGWQWRPASRSRSVLNNLSFSIEPGERVLVMGPSGCGKTTLLQALAGVDQAIGTTTGRLTIDGLLPRDWPGRTGLVMQDPDSQVVLSRIGDEVAFGLEALGLDRRVIWSRVRRSLDSVGLDTNLGAVTRELSGGQKQRLALACALAVRPQLLLLDEPTANLDPQGCRQIIAAAGRVIDRYSGTLLIVEHRLDGWLHLVDRVMVLNAYGELIQDGPVERVIGQNRAELLSLGVWLPGKNLKTPFLKQASSPETGLAAYDLGVVRDRRTVLSGFSRDFGLGQFTAISGKNGCGKSSLLLALAGMISPASGRVEAAEFLSPTPKKRFPCAWRSRHYLGRLGLVFQNPEHQFLTNTVCGELKLGLRRLPLSEAVKKRRLYELVEAFGLSELMDANPYALSGGEKRRLSLATLLIGRPRILLLDEPVFGQDRIAAQRIADLLADLRNSGTGIVCACHDPEFIELLADSHIDLSAPVLSSRARL